MNVGDLGAAALRDRLADGGVAIRVGGTVFGVRSALAALAAPLECAYHDYPLAADGAFRDFDVVLAAPDRAQVEFRVDGQRPFQPLPAAQAFPLLEWGLNWCVATALHDRLIIHAAVLERHGRALILPGAPGAGKSTLTATLLGRGWRLLSDEHTMLEPGSGALIPAPRPVSLKNASIDLIRSAFPQAVLTAPVFDTHKGTIAHLRPSADSVRRADAPAMPAWIVFPSYGAAAQTALRPAPPGQTLVTLARNAFNYDLHAGAGFRLLADTVSRCACFELPFASAAHAADALEAACT